MSDTPDPYHFDWGTLAFSSKKPIKSLRAIFIAAPREISTDRFTQIIKEYLPKAHIVLGIAKETHVEGLEDQPQFRMLRADTIRHIIQKVNASPSKHNIYTLEYFQRETNYLLQKLDFAAVLFVNGSWHHSFHLQPAYYTLAGKHLDYKLISPFTSEVEARMYERVTDVAIAEDQPDLARIASLSDVAMLRLTQMVAKQSYDHTNQTGVIVGKPTENGYQFMLSSYNKVVPYQTYAMHFGSLREKNFSPPNDLNYYDTIHAETAMVIAAQKQGQSLAGSTMFINVLPCPTCGRMLAETDIAEVVYQLDHSDGYTLGVLERAGKKVRRIAL